jgi:hypothetical protein
VEPSSSRPRPAVPPPPPTRRARLRAWVRRRDRAGQRPLLVAVGALVGLVAAVSLAVVTAALLQPRFTILELGAQRLAPDDPSAQPPLEEVGRYGAFDRRYVVVVTTPEGGLPAIVDQAERQRWTVVAHGGASATLERGGVTATVEVRAATTRITTRVADEVRARQRIGVVAAAVAGPIIGAGWVWSQLRGNPRLRPAGRPGDR